MFEQAAPLVSDARKSKSNPLKSKEYNLKTGKKMFPVME